MFVYIYINIYIKNININNCGLMRGACIVVTLEKTHKAPAHCSISVLFLEMCTQSCHPRKKEIIHLARIELATFSV